MARGISYTETKTKSAIQQALKRSVADLYHASCLNWSGRTSDTNKWYSEIICDALLSHIKSIKSIPAVVRKQAYRIRKTDVIRKNNNNRKEENFAKILVNESLSSLGKVLDFQIPIKGKRTDKAGKVDLLSWNIENKTIYLIEYKHIKNNETLLRAVLEIFTYFKQIQHEKIKTEYKPNKKFSNSKIQIKPIVLVHQGSKASIEATEMFYGDRPKLKDFCVALGVDVYTFNFDLRRM